MCPFSQHPLAWAVGAGGHPASLPRAAACSSAFVSQLASRTSALGLPKILQRGREMTQRQVKLAPLVSLILLVRSGVKAFSSLSVTDRSSVRLGGVPVCTSLACCGYEHRAACFSFPFFFSKTVTELVLFFEKKKKKIPSNACRCNATRPEV